MDVDRRPVGFGRGDGDLKHARQERKLRVKGDELADDLGVRPGILYFVPGDAGEGIRGDVPVGVAAGLDGVHLHLGEVGQDVRRILQLGPVVLDVLAGGEMAVAPVIFPGDEGQLAELLRRQQPVGNGDPQHIGVKLHVEAVAQPERPELVLGQFTAHPAGDLIPILLHPLVDQGLIEFVVFVHHVHGEASRDVASGRCPSARWSAPWPVPARGTGLAERRFRRPPRR